MPKKWTKKEAFAHLGAVCVNDRWSWSGRSPDGQTVVATCWQDEFFSRDGRMFYSWRGAPPGADARLGVPEMMENLSLACENCDGCFGVVVTIAKPRKAEAPSKKEIAECFPSSMVMKLLYLDTDRGAFVAERISR
jgi:hypothetical protein